MFSHQVNQLNSGLKVIRIPMPGLRSITTLALVNAGSRYESDSQKGIAHCLEHLLFKGTKEYPDQKVLAILMDSIGADSNAFTSKEYTGYYLNTASKHLKISLEILKELLFYPQLRAEDLEQEKRVISEEIKMHRDNPSHHIAFKFEQMVYRGTGLGHDISGTEQSVNSLHIEDLEQFMDQWYGLGNMVLILAGDDSVVSSQSCLDLINQSFNFQPQSRQNHCKVELSQFLSKVAISDEQFHLESRETAQAHFVLGWPSIKRKDPRRFALSILNTILGGNRSSRLFQEVREKLGLAYYVWSDVDQYHEAGIFGAEAGVNIDKVHQAIEATVKVFYDLAQGNRPVMAEELDQAKDYISGRMVLGLENSQSVARYFGLKELLLKEIEDPDEAMTKLRAVTKEEVESVATDLVKKGELRLAVIGPYQDKERFVQFVRNN